MDVSEIRPDAIIGSKYWIQYTGQRCIQTCRRYRTMNGPAATALLPDSELASSKTDCDSHRGLSRRRLGFGRDWTPCCRFESYINKKNPSVHTKGFIDDQREYCCRV